jgi:hypothetical protein
MDAIVSVLKSSILSNFALPRLGAGELAANPVLQELRRLVRFAGRRDCFRITDDTPIATI